MNLKGFVCMVGALVLILFVVLQVRKQQLTHRVSDLRQLYFWTYQFNMENPDLKSATIQDIVQFFKLDVNDKTVKKLLAGESDGNLLFFNDLSKSEQMAIWKVYFEEIRLNRDGTVSVE